MSARRSAHPPDAAAARAAAPRPVLLSWSGGKDSMLALRRLRRSRRFVPAGLLTTFTEPGDRVASHRVRRTLVEAQARELGLPLHAVLLPPAPSDAVYMERVGAVLAPLGADGLRHVAFGDLFLADLRAWRERHVAALGMTPLFPLWGEDTARLARRFLTLGFAATVVCVDTAVLAPGFAGRPYDLDLLADLPAAADPCGENGELHTFVHAGPLLDRPIAVTAGERETLGRFCYCDLLPAPG